MKTDDVEICGECGCMFVPSLPQDVEHHNWWHEKLILGFKTRKSKNDETIWRNDDLYLTHITPNSILSQRNKAELASKLAKGGLGRNAEFTYFSFKAKEKKIKDYHLFILHYESRGIGLFVVKKKSCIEAKWMQDELVSTHNITEPIWVVDMAWVASSQRGKGMARTAVNAIAEYFSVQAKSMGWSTPFTDSGERLAKAICPETILIYHSGM